MPASSRDTRGAMKERASVPCADIFGGFGSALPGGLDLPQPYAGKVDSLRQLMAALAGEITLMEQVTADLLAGHEGYHAIQDLQGTGPVLAAVIVAETGYIRRFPAAGSWRPGAGLTPRHRESDVKLTRSHVTKQGSQTLRWVVTEAIQRQLADIRLRQAMDTVIACLSRETKNIAKVAARELLCDVFLSHARRHVRRAPRPGAGRVTCQGPRPGAAATHSVPPEASAPTGRASRD